MILADGEAVNDLVPDDERIRIIYLEGHPEIGEKRNLGCELARGDLIAHWDDDDYSAPERLADQVARLMETGKAVTGYHTMRFTDGNRWWIYEGHQNYACGTSLLYSKEWWSGSPFPFKHVGEDNDFINRAYTAGQFLAVAGGEMMYATNHPGNTSPRTQTGRQWKVL